MNNLKKMPDPKERQLTFDDYQLQTSRIVPTRFNSPTSLESSKKFEKNHQKSKYRKAIFEFIKSCGSKGATCDEVETVMDIRHQTASCFIRFLTQDMFLKDSGQKRMTRAKRNAIVWVAA